MTQVLEDDFAYPVATPHHHHGDHPVAFLTDVATGDVFNVHGGANMIGRDPDCDVRIDNGSVSGLHAVLEARVDGTFILTDKHSTNKTRRGPTVLVPQQPYEITDQHELCIGRVKLRFRSVHQTPSRPPPPRPTHVPADVDQNATQLQEVAADDNNATQLQEAVDSNATQVQEAVGFDGNATQLQDNVFETSGFLATFREPLPLHHVPARTHDLPQTLLQDIDATQLQDPDVTQMDDGDEDDGARAATAHASAPGASVALAATFALDESPILARTMAASPISASNNRNSNGGATSSSTEDEGDATDTDFSPPRPALGPTLIQETALAPTLIQTLVQEDVVEDEGDVTDADDDPAPARTATTLAPTLIQQTLAPTLLQDDGDEQVLAASDSETDKDDDDTQEDQPAATSAAEKGKAPLAADDSETDDDNDSQHSAPPPPAQASPTKGRVRLSLPSLSLADDSPTQPAEPEPEVLPPPLALPPPAAADVVGEPPSSPIDLPVLATAMAKATRVPPIVIPPFEQPTAAAPATSQEDKPTRKRGRKNLIEDSQPEEHVDAAGPAAPLAATATAAKKGGHGAKKAPEDEVAEPAAEPVEPPKKRGRPGKIIEAAEPEHVAPAAAPAPSATTARRGGKDKQVAAEAEPAEPELKAPVAATSRRGARGKKAVAFEDEQAEAADPELVAPQGGPKGKKVAKIDSDDDTAMDVDVPAPPAAAAVAPSRRGKASASSSASKPVEPSPPIATVDAEQEVGGSSSTATKKRKAAAAVEPVPPAPEPAAAGNKRGKKVATEPKTEPEPHPAPEPAVPATPRVLKGKGRQVDPPASPLASPREQQKRTAKLAKAICTTGITVDADAKSNIQKLGATWVEAPQDCNLLISDKVHRTVKFLCAIALGRPIVTSSWLTATLKSNLFVDEQLHALDNKDSRAVEKQYGFKLNESLRRAREKPLFDGLQLFVTPGVRPPPAEMKLIIECAGGQMIEKEGDFCKLAVTDKTLVIGSDADAKQCHKLSQKGYACVQNEFVLTGVLAQTVDVGKFKLVTK